MAIYFSENENGTERCFVQFSVPFFIVRLICEESACEIVALHYFKQSIYYPPR